MKKNFLKFLSMILLQTVMLSGCANREEATTSEYMESIPAESSSEENSDGQAVGNTVKPVKPEENEASDEGNSGAGAAVTGDNETDAEEESPKGSTEEMSADNKNVIDSVTYEIVKDDRTLSRENGYDSPLNITVQYYFDRVKVTQDDYPYKDTLNAEFDRIADAFFANEDNRNSMQDMLQTDNSMYADGIFSNYTYVQSIYDQNGVFSVLWTNDWMMGGVSNNIYYTSMFNLETGEKYTLSELLDESEEEAFAEVEDAIASEFEEDPYYQPSWFTDSTSSTNDICFYIDNEGNLNAAFESYQIGMGAYGAPIITIRKGVFPPIED